MLTLPPFKLANSLPWSSNIHHMIKNMELKLGPKRYLIQTCIVARGAAGEGFVLLVLR
jgi:hypothetical protein